MKYNNIENKLNRLISFAETINDSQIIPDIVISEKDESIIQSENERKFYNDLHARRLRRGTSVLRDGKLIINQKLFA